MISLVQLLKEAQGEPKAIILAGAPGAGKGYVLRGLDLGGLKICLLYTSPSPRDRQKSRMPSSA